MSQSHRIVGLGNPLLDISAVTPQAFLEKYGLRLNNAILAGEEQKELYEEMARTFPCAYLAGGATQNTVRAAAWALREPGAVAYFGAVGNDEYAQRLRTALENAQVANYYQSTPEHPTGTCACLIQGKERSLVANLGASIHFQLSHLEAHIDALRDAQVIYSSGYFYTSSPSGAIRTAQYAGETGKTYSTNLAAEFIVETCKDTFDAVLPYSELVFCNDSEMRKYGQVHGLLDLPLVALAQALADLPQSIPRPRKVIVTCGAEPTIVATSHQPALKYPVPPIDPSLIVDTNGAGDSFVGAFLAEWVRGGDLARCIAAGHYLAGEVIKREGCVLPDQPCSDFPVLPGESA